MDYVSLTEVLMFDECDTQQCVNVTIVDDLVNDPAETFHVFLERASGLDTRIILDPDDGEIAIGDNDGINIYMCVPITRFKVHHVFITTKQHF